MTSGWRRYYLYKIHCVNSFVAQMNDAAQLHGLRTDFVFYPPELNMNPWNWGYDIVGLEKYCSHMWVSQGERRFYRNINGMCFDMGLTQARQDLVFNYSCAFNGKPISFFFWTSAIYHDAVRKQYSTNKAFTEKVGGGVGGDIYSGHYGYSDKELSLFLGPDNIKRWCDTITKWQGGESPRKNRFRHDPHVFYHETSGRHWNRIRQKGGRPSCNRQSGASPRTE